MTEVLPYKTAHRIRVVSAAALFDGHDAAINVIRRVLQSSGAEVIHLGHNRSAAEVVEAAIEEDAHAVAISSYQGGHMEFFKYTHDLLREHGCGHIMIFGGGGGVIVPEEIEQLHAYGIARIFSPEDGLRLGLQGMINEILRACDGAAERNGRDLTAENLRRRDPFTVSRAISLAELISLAESNGRLGDEKAGRVAVPILGGADGPAPILGVTGTGGSGKSSLVDELVLRYLEAHPERTVAILAVDPSRRTGYGGALLGDRIRINMASHPNVYMRSFATRDSGSELSAAMGDAISICRAAGYDLIVLETYGIGQGESIVVDVCDVSVYVMTPEYGAPSQLEKIEILELADFIALNKFERRGGADALRDVRKQVRRNRRIDPAAPDEQIPVFPTIAAQFNDSGVNALFEAIDAALEAVGQDAVGKTPARAPEYTARPGTQVRDPIVPPERERYLAEIVRTIEAFHERVESMAESARRAYRIDGALEALAGGAGKARLVELREAAWAELSDEAREGIEGWDELHRTYGADEFVYTVRGREVRAPLYAESLSGTRIPKVALPKPNDWGDRLRWLMRENVPGRFPYTAGVFPLKRRGEDPKRMFAGEGPPVRTNRRFHLLCEGEPAKRLSTAFDSVTLYGEDPAERPDIFGKIGESGVSICSLDDMKKLFAGFDLCDPATSVSMTINGPAPFLLAMFLNTAIDQQVDRFAERGGREPDGEELARIRADALRVVRGTVQADILKEDQAQNTCIFSTDFALRMMGDVQAYFIENEVRNYYSVSISGYHIAEAGANPITQLAFTLANGFTYVEYYLARGLKVDEFAPNLSFFFSNGLDPEYAVLGRVARRIWAVAMRERYGASERFQKLKYHIQTSGRSLHAKDVAFNDIRTTLQALMAIYDNCNSLHTNAYDEAVTTPSEESVRRAMAIQMIINREFGLTLNENPLQGSFIIEELTDLVERAVLAEFRRLSDRGGVLGAMERQYQRGRIQEESMLYERLKHSGELPIIGVNTFLSDGDGAESSQVTELARATVEEKQQQIANLRAFQDRHAGRTPEALERLQQVARSGGNVFAELMESVKVASLGQLTQALYVVGGRYRRNM